MAITNVNAKTITIGDKKLILIDEGGRNLMGTLSSLTTSVKTSLVAAINELVSALSGKADSSSVHSIPSGGSSGYVLKKASGTNYDVEWAEESGGGSSVEPYTSNPSAPGTASPGSSDKYARGDHVHPAQTVPSAQSSGTPADLGVAARGSSTTYSRSDHVHKMPSASDVGAVALAQGVQYAGDFLVVGNNGNVVPVTMSAWSAGSY